jgi:tight adherence protein C
MIDAPLVISLLVFSATTLFFVALLLHLGYLRGRQTIIQKLKQDDRGSIVEEADKLDQASGGEALKGRWLAILARLGQLAKPNGEDEVTHIQKLFLRAGYRGNHAAVTFFGAKVVCAAGLLVAVLALQFVRPGEVRVLNMTLLAVVFAVIGFYLPNLWLSIKIARRKEALTLGLPDALDLLVVCAEAGMGLDAAMKRVGEEMKLSSKAISEELSLLNLELRVGKSRKDALKNLAARADLEEVNSLVTLLIQTDKFGTSVAQALRVHSDAMRTRRTQRVEELAARLPIKLLFPTIFCIFPSLFLVIVGPALLQAYKYWSN